MKELVGILVPVALFACITLSVYFVNRFRYDAIKTLGGPIPRTPKSRFSWKRTGIIALGFSIGLLLVGFLQNLNLIQDNQSEGFFIIGTITFCVGCALFIADRVNTNEEEIDG
ncbi:hypothetical protein GQF61_12820 [Sphingobacterium sp. DK4209]|uniref:Uncharacterized protein n=1 Tax=Sphingobacterium zhuxiongii TaxID=2662364 RepID=A0A5Q0Q8H7_9SPHI|nr:MULTISPECIES: hypothetical protein [unclassified Sphingobacterium]MVZ66737.1 hypothetical protein [Sphingobacterium sp. DK4209]QGA26275.1 hypothetical protein GFH32_08025 [Sphingobacterium sp. dk4302]